MCQKNYRRRIVASACYLIMLESLQSLTGQELALGWEITLGTELTLGPELPLGLELTLALGLELKLGLTLAIGSELEPSLEPDRLVLTLRIQWCPQRGRCTMSPSNPPVHQNPHLKNSSRMP
jgi:hypothetical protein